MITNNYIFRQVILILCLSSPFIYCINTPTPPKEPTIESPTINSTKGKRELYSFPITITFGSQKSNRGFLFFKTNIITFNLTNKKTITFPINDLKSIKISKWKKKIIKTNLYNFYPSTIIITTKANNTTTITKRSSSIDSLIFANTLDGKKKRVYSFFRCALKKGRWQMPWFKSKQNPNFKPHPDTFFHINFINEQQSDIFEAIKRGLDF